MRKVLHQEIRRERCNAAALGLFNAGVMSGGNPIEVSQKGFERERKIIKTRAGFALMEKASKEDMYKNRTITYIKDDNADYWYLLRSDKTKKNLISGLGK
ncbi:hypothetical protein KRE43_12725 [Elizabethkingia meningoseptica]|uniref:hypothetical protein n=1 Tax=Elizabethkingia meningoseptica TaxID=238 RepID=UPI0023B1734C|nr:hypothetical protein [Elizabethkingia meningoseptica]MDE5530458.1 hypothetical protein [Elizabethkingia meningoseptica]MDE5534015.1 hypothetical protein [Elizabethkingia meningoseptica]MDE5542709.1 hypothetical protein [Elizabethkingia meningoseptica]